MMEGVIRSNSKKEGSLAWNAFGEYIKKCGMQFIEKKKEKTAKGDCGTKDSLATKLTHQLEPSKKKVQELDQPAQQQVLQPKVSEGQAWDIKSLLKASGEIVEYLSNNRTETLLALLILLVIRLQWTVDYLSNQLQEMKYTSGPTSQ